mgnify:CR=1 FL=1
MTRRFPIISLLMLSLVFSSCFKSTVTRKFYVIEPPQAAVASSESPIFNLKVDVRDFQVAPAFDQTRIALRTASHELNYYYYHQWAVKPSQGVANVVYDIVQRQKLFVNITRGISYNPNYLITGEVKNIERRHVRKKAFAKVHLILTLADAETGKAVVQLDESEEREIRKDGAMNSFAEAVSDMISIMSQRFGDAIIAELSLKSNP